MCFAGEAGLDDNGVRREFVSLAAREFTQRLLHCLDASDHVYTFKYATCVRYANRVWCDVCILCVFVLYLQAVAKRC